MQGKSEEQNAPGYIHRDPQCGCGEWIERRASENRGERGLRDEQVLERAGVAGLFEATVKRIESGAQIVEKNETDESERKVAAALRERLAKFRTVHETGDVIKHSRTEKGLNDFHDERAVIGLRNVKIATEEKPDFTQEGIHGCVSPA